MVGEKAIVVHSTAHALQDNLDVLEIGARGKRARITTRPPRRAFGPGCWLHRKRILLPKHGNHIVFHTLAVHIRSSECDTPSFCQGLLCRCAGLAAASTSCEKRQGEQ